MKGTPYHEATPCSVYAIGGAGEGPIVGAWPGCCGGAAGGCSADGTDAGGFAIGRRCAQPARTSAMKNAPKAAEIRIEISPDEARKFTMRTESQAFDSWFAFGFCPSRRLISSCASEIFRYYRNAAKMPQGNHCHSPYAGVGNWNDGAIASLRCFALRRRNAVRNSAPHAARWSARQPRDATSAAQA